MSFKKRSLFKRHITHLQTIDIKQKINYHTSSSSNLKLDRKLVFPMEINDNLQLPIVIKNSSYEKAMMKVDEAEKNTILAKYEWQLKECEESLYTLGRKWFFGAMDKYSFDDKEKTALQELIVKKAKKIKAIFITSNILATSGIIALTTINPVCLFLFILQLIPNIIVTDNGYGATSLAAYWFKAAKYESVKEKLEMLRQT